MTQGEVTPQVRHAVSVEWDARGGCEWSCSCFAAGQDYREAVAHGSNVPLSSFNTSSPWAGGSATVADVRGIADGPHEVRQLRHAVDKLARVVENGLAQIAAAIAAHQPSAVHTSQAGPWLKGDRCRRGTQRGKIASAGAAGMGVLWADGKYDLLLMEQVKALVRE